ncbi:MAG: LemA family protein [Nitrospirota bacterium]|nr:LemA family protein [Nitrospirota bacterium]
MATVAIATWGATNFMKLQRLQATRDHALANLAAALHERQDLTLELVRFCASYLVPEKTLIEAVALSRSYAMQARTVLARTKTETDLCWALARLLLAAENHPELLSQPRYSELLTGLGESENQATQARNEYNRAVEELEDFLHGPSMRPLAHTLHMIAGQPFELDPKIAREAMMTMLTPRRATGAPEGAELAQPMLPKVASVAFNL